MDEQAKGVDADAKAADKDKGKDEVALELMKFIAIQTSFGKGTAPAAGFSGKPATRSAEEHAEALLQLFERCRQTLNK